MGGSGLGHPGLRSGGGQQPSCSEADQQTHLADRDNQPEWLRAEELAHSSCPERVAEFDAAGLLAHCSGWRAACPSQAAGVAVASAPRVAPAAWFRFATTAKVLAGAVLGQSV